MATNIEWSANPDGTKGMTWNPVIGCTPVSPGCLNCYAATMANRMQAMPQTPEYHTRLGVDGQGKSGQPIRIAEVRNGRAVFTGDVRTVPDRLTEPLHWRKPRRVFVNSMSDLFHEAVPFEFIDRVFAVMLLCQHHQFQVLTKRPDRMAKYLKRTETRNGFQLGAMEWIVVTAIGLCNDVLGRGFADDAHAYELDIPTPIPNVWVGCSVENQPTADERIPHLQRCPAAVRFLSVEPQIGPIVYRDEWAKGLHWAIGGGESGPHARPYDVSWPRAGIAWARKHGVAWFQKQLGACIQVANDSHSEWPREGDGLIYPADYEPRYQGEPHCVRLEDKKGGDPAEWPTDIRVREWPKVSKEAAT